VRLEHPGLLAYEGAVTVDAQSRGWLTVTLEEPQATGPSPATWAVGAIGAASLIAGAVMGGFAIARHDEFERALGNPGSTSLASIRNEGMALNIATDTLLATGLVALVVATIIYFATDGTTQRPSRATFSAGER
jgi:hypothetical protein